MKKVGSKTLLCIAALLLFLTTLVPMIWVMISSLKTKKEMIRSPWNLPEKLQWSNYAEAWERGNFGQLAKNSIVITVTAVFLMLVLSAMIAFALSRYRGRLGKAVLMYLLIGQTISAAMIIFPIVILLRSLGLGGSHLGLILTYAAGGLPFAAFVMQGFFAGIPKELYESGEMDGAGEFTLFVRIALPLAKPAVATVLLYQFMWVWNEFVLAFTVIDKVENRTIIVGLYSVVNGQLQTNYVLAFAGAMIVSVPIIVVYLCFQKYLIQGLITGAVKG